MPDRVASDRPPRARRGRRPPRAAGRCRGTRRRSADRRCRLRGSALPSRSASRRSCSCRRAARSAAAAARAAIRSRRRSGCRRSPPNSATRSAPRSEELHVARPDQRHDRERQQPRERGVLRREAPPRAANAMGWHRCGAGNRAGGAAPDPAYGEAVEREHQQRDDAPLAPRPPGNQHQRRRPRHDREHQIDCVRRRMIASAAK